MHQDDQELGDRQKLARVACGKAKRCQQAESCAAQARLFLRIKEEGIREGPLLGRERDGMAVDIAP